MQPAANSPPSSIPFSAVTLSPVPFGMDKDTYRKRVAVVLSASVSHYYMTGGYRRLKRCLKEEVEEKEDANRIGPAISYIRQPNWSLDNPGNDYFDDNQNFIEYLRYDHDFHPISADPIQISMETRVMISELFLFLYVSSNYN